MIWLVLIAVFAGIPYISEVLHPPGAPVSGRARAVDGDTLRLGRERVRLLGIDAPEIAQTCRRDGRRWPCGVAARTAMARLVQRGTTRCAPRGRDRYGRLLAVCRTAGADLSASMAAAGLAVSRGDYGAEQAAAQRARKGVWAGTFEDPRAWRDAHTGAATQHTPLDWIKSLLNR